MHDREREAWIRDAVKPWTIADVHREESNRRLVASDGIPGRWHRPFRSPGFEPSWRFRR